MLPGYAAEKIEYPINRYDNETRRLYRTMDTHLAKSPHGFLVGDRLTIADIACWGWVSSHSRPFPLCYPHHLGYSVKLIMVTLSPLDKDGVPLDEFPHLEKWLFKLLKRPGFEKGRNVPERHTAFD